MAERETPFGAAGRSRDSMNLWRRLWVLHLCVTQGRFGSEWENQPAVLSCGDSGDSLENGRKDLTSYY